MNKIIRVGFSPCPNDTFMFDALINNRIDTEGIQFVAVMADVEQLNQMAVASELEMTKLSFHAFAHVLDTYQMLSSGSALGRGVGPLLISGEPMSIQDAASSPIAIPGRLTTAVFLLQLFLDKPGVFKEMIFSEIENAVLNGEVNSGLIIHENRFTYADRGLHKIADMGELWEQKTGLPIPLGGIALRRDIGHADRKKINSLLKKSIEYAFHNPEISLPFVQANSQEMDPEVIQKHIQLYVNDFSLDIGDEGRVAIQLLLEIALEKDLIKHDISDAVLN